MLRSKQNRGFSLIELMIALAILTIIVSVALPSYEKSVQKSRRSDVIIALEKAAAMQEQFYFLNNQYTTDVNNLGGSSGNLDSPEGHYSIKAYFFGNTDNQTYQLIAMPKSNSPQADDSECQEFSLDYTGRKDAYDKNGATTTEICLY